MTRNYSVPRKLDRGDSRDEFSSGADELDEWFRKYAWENQRANNAVTFVSCEGESIAGYYAIAVGAIALADAPRRLRQAAPSEIPCIVLARLAVDSHHTGTGLGAALLLDALKRAAMLSESVGARAVLIHARDDAAKAFYLHNIDCLQSPVDELQLVIPMKDIIKILAVTG